MKNDCNKIYVVYSPLVWTSGSRKGANHAQIEEGRTLCGKSTIGWEGASAGLKSVNCVICRRKLKKMGCL